MSDDSSYNFRIRKPDPTQIRASATHASPLPVSPDEKASMTVIELFPIRASSLPAFTAYQLEVQEETLALIGGKFAYCCNDHFPGHWFWVDHHLVTDTPLSVPTQQFAAIISSLWETQPDPYRGLLAIHPDPAWCSSPTVQAEFVARCLCQDQDIYNALRQQLQSYRVALNPQVAVQRLADLRGWVVSGQPALAISIRSDVLATMNLSQHARSLSNVEQLKGLLVMDKRTHFTGEITEIHKTVAEQRERLLKLTKNSLSQKVIQQADPNEPVVYVKRGAKGYDYVLSALQAIVRMENCGHFNIDAGKLLKIVRIAPEQRSAMVKQVSAVLQQRKLIDRAYTTEHTPSHFLTALDIGYAPRLLLGGGQSIPGDVSLREPLRQYGFYQRAERFPQGTPVNVGILTGLNPFVLRPLLEGLRQECQKLNCSIQINRLVASIADPSRDRFEQAIELLRTIHPDIILAIFPDASLPDLHAIWCNSPDDPYYHLKSLTVSRDLPSQVVSFSNCSKIGAMTNIAIGLLSKIGNIPFILADPLPYADVFVGLDIARRTKATLAGTMNVLATAHIYQQTAPYVRYHVQDTLLEGETIPTPTLQTFFSRQHFAGKRVLIHRDGHFRGNEMAALKAWAKKIDATFFFVEVIKSGSPRLYRWMPPAASEVARFLSPEKGIAFCLNSQEAFLVSTPPPFAQATPQPLHIRAEPPFSIKEALHSVLSLTLLHYGSVRPPRLPVTTHYSDKMAGLALRGIRPATTEGVDPYWL